MAFGTVENYHSHASWYRNFLETCLDPGDRPLLLGIADDDGRPCAILPLRRTGRSNLLPGANQIDSLSNFYTCGYQPLAAPDTDRRSVASDIAGALWHQLRDFDVLRLDSLPKENGWPEDLAAALRDAGFFVDAFFHFGNWYEVVAGWSYDDYLASRPTKLRNTIRRRERKLREAEDVTFEMFKTQAEGERAMADYRRVYQASWKEPEPYSRFTDGLIHHAAGAGALRLGVLRSAGRPIAAQIWLHAEGRSTIFKLAYDEAYKALSPGTVLTAWMLRQALETDQVREIDFGRGDDPYKRDWLSQRRERWGILACNPRRARGLLVTLRHLAGPRLKRFLRAEQAETP
ncbi:MAG: GNAT family N-acetyltransferase [Alphaproteobacteria bacterium]|nr:GNAT family N-acetyltransferase [Alphaproteobacteria bacterium]